MKTIFINISVLSLLFFNASLSSSEELTKDAKIKWIRKNYQSIEKSIVNVEPSTAVLNEFDYYVFYKAGNRIVKIELHSEGVRTTFYYKDRKVFFIFIENAWNRVGGGLTKPYREERIYIYDGKIIDALIKETDAETFDGVENKPHEKILSSPSKYESELIDGYFGAKTAFDTCRAEQ